MFVDSQNTKITHLQHFIICTSISHSHQSPRNPCRLGEIASAPMLLVMPSPHQLRLIPTATRKLSSRSSLVFYSSSLSFFSSSLSPLSLSFYDSPSLSVEQSMAKEAKDQTAAKLLGACKVLMIKM